MMSVRNGERTVPGANERKLVGRPAVERQPLLMLPVGLLELFHLDFVDVELLGVGLVSPLDWRPDRHGVDVVHADLT